MKTEGGGEGVGGAVESVHALSCSTPSLTFVSKYF